MSAHASQDGSLPRLMAAGILAGTAEIGLTYPLEYHKVRSQLPTALIDKIGRPALTLKLFRGCGTMMLGNGTKTIVRFVTYDFLSRQIADENGHISAPRSLAAGLLAGFMESTVLVPFEVAKIRQISSLATSPPGTFATFKRIVQLHGPLGLLYGFFPTLLRQGAASAVRFTAYNSLRQMADGFVTPGDRLSPAWATGLELLASYAAVITTMPIDVVKTRMQTLSGREAAHGNNLLCTYQIFTTEGPRKLFSGMMPRLLRVTISSMVMFSFYEVAFKAVSFIDERPGASNSNGEISKPLAAK
ncbi:mitochondrial carrier domain-containing protein [Lipomyces chichibuensis]|uniref:mitochondrial carrier domain-containing protein n=1 Tax=Lipomyces chichibuensis TaxID=1546026 RepID=UPI0033437BBF